jgi:hypothetical protein
MGRGRLARAAICGLLLTAGGSAYAQDAPAPPPDLKAVLEGRTLRVTSGGSTGGVGVVDLGCVGRASLQTGSKVLVACGPDGVVEVDVSSPLAPRRSGQMPVDGDATGLFLRDGRAWVEIAHVEAKVVRTGPAAPSPAPTSAPLPDAPPPAPAAAVAPPAAPPKPSILAPPRRGGLWELSALAGAFVNLGPQGGGGVGWASAVYRFDAPIVVRAELAPFGVAVAHPSTNTFGGYNVVSTQSPMSGMAVAAGHVLVGLDTQFVEAAIGGGASTISNSYNPSCGTSYSGSTAPCQATTGGVSIVEEGRFGARDGLALVMESTTVAAYDRFQFGSFAASIQVPITSKILIFGRGGGGGVGALFGDLGARVFVRGDGGPDTLALTGFFGGMGIDFTSCASAGVIPPVNPVTNAGPTAVSTRYATTCQGWSLGGPSIGGGVEWRR